jgi:hypothetical protein
MSTEPSKTRRTALPTRSSEAVELGGLLAVLLLAGLWTTLVARAVLAVTDALPVDLTSPFLFGAFVTNVLGYGVPAVAYARFRGVDLRLSRPSVDDLPAVFLALVVPALLLGGVSLLGNALFDTPLSAVLQRFVSPRAGLAAVARSTLGPAVFGAVGVGLLYYGTVMGVIRERLGAGPVATVVLTTVVAGFFRLVAWGSSVSGPADLPFVAVLLVVLVAFGASVGLLYRGVERGSLRDSLTRWDAPVLVVGWLALFAALLELVELPASLQGPLWVLVLATGALAAERTDSAVAGAVAVFSFHLSAGLAVYGEALLGLAAP